MKKFFVSVMTLFVIIIFFSPELDALSSKRIDWWGEKLASLEAERENIISEDELDESVIKYMNRDIERARAIQSYYARAVSGGIDAEEFSSDVIQGKVDEIMKPYFAAVYLNSYFKLNRSPDHRFDIFLHEEIEKKTAEFMNGDISGLADEILKTISRDSREGIWQEFAAEAMIKIADDKYASHKSKLIEKISENSIVSESLIVAAVEDFYSEERDIYPEMIETDALDTSPSWQKEMASLERSFKAFRVIEEFLPEDELPADKLMIYFRRPVEFDTAFFSRLRNEIIRLKDGDKREFPEPRYEEILNSVDILRRRNISLIKGKEDREFFEKIESSMQDVVERGFRETEKFFDEKSHIEDDLTLQKQKYENIRKWFNDYIKTSSDFLYYLGDIRSVKPEDIVAGYQSKTAASIKHFDFAAELTETGALLGSVDSAGAASVYAEAVRGSSDFFKSRADSAEIPRYASDYLNNDELQKLRNLRQEWREDFHRIRMGVKENYASFSERRREISDRKNSIKDEVDAVFAQKEIITLYENAREYVDLFNNMKYTEELIGFYEIKYVELEKQAESGNISDELNEVLKSDSILKSISSYSENTFEREKKSRDWAKRAASKEISRLETMIDLYKRQEVDVRYTPGRDEIDSLRSSLNRVPEVQIASWRMNESNYLDIDPRAAKRLSSIVNRRAWSSVEDSVDKKRVPARLKSDEIVVSFYIPYGWMSEAFKEQDRSVCRIDGPDGETYIEVLLMDFDGSEDLDTAGKSVSLNRDDKTTRVRWGEKEDIEYYWFAARGRGDRVIETFVFSYNGKMILVKGETDRAKYNFFKKKIDELFESISI